MSSVPGTTHDVVDTPILWKEETPITLIDTAGITRRAIHDKGLDRSCLLWSLKAIERSDVCILVVDAAKGVQSAEQKIAGDIVDNKRSVIVAINKCDLLINQRNETKEAYEKLVREELKFMSWVPLVFVSATTGFQVSKLVDVALDIYYKRYERIPTHKLNELVKKAAQVRPPPTKGHIRLSIDFCTQTKSSRPTFLFFVNYPELVHFSYERFLENFIREHYEFPGTPIKLIFKKKVGGHAKYTKKKD